MGVSPTDLLRSLSRRLVTQIGLRQRSLCGVPTAEVGRRVSCVEARCGIGRCLRRVLSSGRLSARLSGGTRRRARTEPAAPFVRTKVVTKERQRGGCRAKGAALRRCGASVANSERVSGCRLRGSGG